MKKVHYPWKTSEVPMSHWASVLDYSLKPHLRGNPCPPVGHEGGILYVE